MATDWVKMRTDLYRDPKVILIADHLMASTSELSRYINAMTRRDSNVTRNVTRCATVGALVTLWGTLRHTGKRDNDDLIVTGGAIPLIDDIVDLAGFGEALASVGWVEVSKVGLVFPNFYRDYNADPDEKYRKNAAERQRKHRQKAAEQHSETTAEPLRNSNVTVTQRSNATVTQCHTTEKRREEDRRVEEKREEKRIEETKEDPTTAQCEKFARAEYSPDFQRFWDAYPTKRRLGKKQAYAAWQKAIKTADAEAIVGKAAEYAASDRGQGEYSCMPATWLNQGRWEDDPAAWQDDRQLTTERKPSQPKTFTQIREERTKDVFRKFHESGQFDAIVNAVRGTDAESPDRADGGDATSLHPRIG